MDVITTCLFDMKSNRIDYQVVTDYVTLLPLMIKWKEKFIDLFPLLSIISKQNFKVTLLESLFPFHYNYYTKNLLFDLIFRAKIILRRRGAQCLGSNLERRICVFRSPTLSHGAQLIIFKIKIF